MSEPIATNRGFFPLTRLLTHRVIQDQPAPDGVVRMVTHGRRIPDAVETYVVAVFVFGFWVASLMRLAQGLIEPGIAIWILLFPVVLIAGFVVVHALALTTAVIFEFVFVQPGILDRAHAGDLHSYAHAVLITAISFSFVIFGAWDWFAWISGVWLAVAACNGIAALIVPLLRVKERQ